MVISSCTFTTILSDVMLKYRVQKVTRNWGNDAFCTSTSRSWKFLKCFFCQESILLATAVFMEKAKFPGGNKSLLSHYFNLWETSSHHLPNPTVKKKTQGSPLRPFLPLLVPPLPPYLPLSILSFRWCCLGQFPGLKAAMVLWSKALQNFAADRVKWVILSTLEEKCTISAVALLVDGVLDLVVRHLSCEWKIWWFSLFFWPPCWPSG